jgi:hypothetical protein
MVMSRGRAVPGDVVAADGDTTCKSTCDDGLYHADQVQRSWCVHGSRYGAAEWSTKRVYTRRARNRRQTAHEHRSGSPWHGYLILLCEVTVSCCAWSPRSTLRSSAVLISERHSTIRYNSHRLIAFMSLLVDPYDPANASSTVMRSWTQRR